MLPGTAIEAGSGIRGVADEAGLLRCRCGGACSNVDEKPLDSVATCPALFGVISVYNNDMKPFNTPISTCRAFFDCIHYGHQH